MAGSWTPDILGAPFEQLTLELGEDAQGPVVATLVRSVPHRISALAAPLRDVDVLYVHGWSDYFFQRELAASWNRLGARFYALDLHATPHVDDGQHGEPGPVIHEHAPFDPQRVGGSFPPLRSVKEPPAMGLW
jgi:hypothetical protein